MTEAWIAREIQRKDILDQLMQAVYDCAEKNFEKEPNFLLLLASAITMALDQNPSRKLARRAKAWPAVNAAWRVYDDKIYPRIASFSRSSAERDALVAAFLRDYVLKAALDPFFRELQREEIICPEKIFRTKSAMEKIPFPVVK